MYMYYIFSRFALRQLIHSSFEKKPKRSMEQKNWFYPADLFLTLTSPSSLDAKFSLGEVVASPSIIRNLEMEEIDLALRRHQSGDWGDVFDSDRRENDIALKEGAYLLSTYHSKAGLKFWIITEFDRSRTVVMVPGD
jgi:hypothetical protein